MNGIHDSLDVVGSKETVNNVLESLAELRPGFGKGKERVEAFGRNR